MKLDFELALEKIDELSKTFLILSNLKRLRLVLLLNKIEPSSSAEIHRLAKKERIYDNRETTYRALEELVKTKLVSKVYEEQKKELIYSVKRKNENNS